ncbi:MAG: DNA polymerase III subunit beta [Candidatus Dormibacteraceae bacterium]
MNITCQPQELSQALQSVSRAVAVKSTLPILNNLLLETTDNGLAITATNLEIGIRKSIRAEVLQEGGTTIPARPLTEFVGVLPDKPLNLALESDRQVINMNCGQFKTHLNCLSPEEFPPTPQPDQADRLVVEIKTLLKAIEQTKIAVSNDESSPQLTGQLFKIAGSDITLVATDGHRLTEFKFTADVISEPIQASLIIPSRALSEMARTFRDAEGNLEILISKARNQIFFRSKDSDLYSQLIDGKYPQYNKLVEKIDSTVIVVSTPELMRTVKAVSIFSRDGANVVKVKVDKNYMTIASMTNDVGGGTADIPARINGPEVNTAFNSRYLIDALSVIDSEELELHVAGPKKPGIIKLPGNDKYISVVMPVRLTD